uniref:Uncharacterized protein n=1 Tax=Glossina austeni TaxID=7395 RepID=A0A1A9VL79_GLOAU
MRLERDEWLFLKNVIHITLGPNPTASSSVSQPGSIFPSPPRSALNAGVETCTVGSLTRSIVGCPAEEEQATAWPGCGMVSGIGAGSASVSKSSGNVYDVSAPPSKLFDKAPVA